jgi:hypothetical protein
MKVQVTKDTFGVAVWPIDADVILKDKRIDGQRVSAAWIINKFTFNQKKYQILNYKQTSTFFPSLGQDIRSGEKKEMDFSITVPTQP